MNKLLIKYLIIVLQVVSNSHKKYLIYYLDINKNCIKDSGNNKNDVSKEQKDNQNNKKKNINIKTFYEI